MNKPLIRYTLLQVPGWLLLGALLWWAVGSDWIAVTTAVWVMTAWLLKDAVLYPICRAAFEDNHPVESQKLIGLEAEAVKELAPEGLVRVNGELWSARHGQDGVIEAGRHIRIIGAEGLVLIVEPI